MARENPIYPLQVMVDGGHFGQQHKHERVVPSSPALDSHTATDDSVSGQSLLLPSAAFIGTTVTKTETAVRVNKLCDNGIILSETSSNISVLF